MNTQSILTVCTADHFQHHIPLFIRCIRRWGDGVDIHIFVRGELDDLTKKAMSKLEEYGVCKGYDFIHENYAMDYPFDESTTNCLRFLVDTPEICSYAQTMITDVDLMLFNDLFPWHMQRMVDTEQPFAGHHGPWRKPYRPEVSKEGWVGAFERVAGGFFCTTPAWYVQTAKQREYQSHDLKDGRLGKWRESDEVMLSRIIKGSGMKVPGKGFPLELRGVHLGDFKPSMKHRYTDMGKMATKLSESNAQNYLLIRRDKAFSDVLDIVKKDPEIAEVFNNLDWHIEQRGLQ